MSHIHELFDMIAPIAIMHRTDLRYGRMAKKQVRKLWKWIRENPQEAQKQGFSQGVKEENIRDYVNHQHPDLCPDALVLYNDLFQEIVLEKRPESMPIFDYYGARGFRNEAGEMIFVGDDSGMYAWYLTAAAIFMNIETQEGGLAHA